MDIRVPHLRSLVNIAFASLALLANPSPSQQRIPPPAPRLEWKLDAQQRRLLLEVTAAHETFHAAIFANDTGKAIPPNEAMPPILVTDLVLATGKARQGKLTVEVPLPVDMLRDRPLFLQAVLITPQGTAIATPIQRVAIPTKEIDKDIRGVALRTGAVIYAGCPHNCSKPATIDFDRVRRATPEGQAIDAERIRRGTARFQILVQRMHNRVLAAARKAAEQSGCDLVVRAGDIADAKGLPVLDLTESLLGRQGAMRRQMIDERISRSAPDHSRSPN